MPDQLGSDGLAGFGREMSESLSMSALEVEEGPEFEEKHDSPGVSGLAHPNSISAKLYTNPNLAPLRTVPSHTTPSPMLTTTSPILVDPQCSGYFVEVVRPYDSMSYYSLVSRHQMKWMEPFLVDGEMAGRIICPNKKCGAKLGNYDWAGVRCNCKAWVVPVSAVL